MIIHLYLCGDVSSLAVVSVAMKTSYSAAAVCCLADSVSMPAAGNDAIKTKHCGPDT